MPKVNIPTPPVPTIEIAIRAPNGTPVIRPITDHPLMIQNTYWGAIGGVNILNPGSRLAPAAALPAYPGGQAVNVIPSVNDKERMEAIARYVYDSFLRGAGAIGLTEVPPTSNPNYLHLVAALRELDKGRNLLDLKTFAAGTHWQSTTGTTFGMSILYNPRIFSVPPAAPTSDLNRRAAIYQLHTSTGQAIPMAVIHGDYMAQLSTARFIRTFDGFVTGDANIFTNSLGHPVSNSPTLASIETPVIPINGTNVALNTVDVIYDNFSRKADRSFVPDSTNIARSSPTRTALPGLIPFSPVELGPFHPTAIDSLRTHFYNYLVHIKGRTDLASTTEYNKVFALNGTTITVAHPDVYDAYLEYSIESQLYKATEFSSSSIQVMDIKNAFLVYLNNKGYSITEIPGWTETFDADAIFVTVTINSFTYFKELELFGRANPTRFANITPLPFSLTAPVAGGPTAATSSSSSSTPTQHQITVLSKDASAIRGAFRKFGAPGPANNPNYVDGFQISGNPNNTQLTTITIHKDPLYRQWQTFITTNALAQSSLNSAAEILNPMPTPPTGSVVSTSSSSSSSAPFQYTKHEITFLSQDAQAILKAFKESTRRDVGDSPAFLFARNANNHQLSTITILEAALYQQWGVFIATNVLAQNSINNAASILNPMPAPPPTGHIASGGPAPVQPTRPIIRVEIPADHRVQNIMNAIKPQLGIIEDGEPVSVPGINYIRGVNGGRSVLEINPAQFVGIRNVLEQVKAYAADKPTLLAAITKAENPTASTSTTTATHPPVGPTPAPVPPVNTAAQAAQRAAAQRAAQLASDQAAARAAQLAANQAAARAAQLAADQAAARAAQLATDQAAATSQEIVVTLDTDKATSLIERFKESTNFVVSGIQLDANKSIPGVQLRPSTEEGKLQIVFSGANASILQELFLDYKKNMDKIDVVIGKIEVVLTELHDKTNGINKSEWSKGHKAATDLHRDLIAATNKYKEALQKNPLAPEPAGEAYQQECQALVDKARPILENDVGWGKYLWKLLKDLVRYIFKIERNSPSSFFAHTPSKSEKVMDEAHKKLKDDESPEGPREDEPSSPTSEAKNQDYDPNDVDPNFGLR